MSEFRTEKFPCRGIRRITKVIPSQLMGFPNTRVEITERNFLKKPVYAVLIVENIAIRDSPFRTDLKCICYEKEHPVKGDRNTYIPMCF